MKSNPTNIVISGAIESEELSEIQKNLVYVLAYCGKIAMTTAATTIKSRVKKPDAMEVLKRQLEKDKKTFESMTNEEYEKYKNILFQSITEELGGTQHYLNFLLLELRSNRKFQNLMSKAGEEAIKLAESSISDSMIQKSDDSRYT